MGEVEGSSLLKRDKVFLVCSAQVMMIMTTIMMVNKRTIMMMMLTMMIVKKKQMNVYLCVDGNGGG